MKIIPIPENSYVNIQKMHYTLQKIEETVFSVKKQKNVQNLDKS